MVRIHHNPLAPYDCDGRTEFVRLTKDGKTWINADEIPAGQVRTRVAALMQDRAERIVYVMVDSDLSYGQFAGFLDKIEGATDDLHVVVVSGKIRREFEKPMKLIPPGKDYLGPRASQRVRSCVFRKPINSLVDMLDCPSST